MGKYITGKTRKGCYEKKTENKKQFFEIENILAKIIIIIMLDDEVEEISQVQILRF